MVHEPTKLLLAQLRHLLQTRESLRNKIFWVFFVL